MSSHSYSYSIDSPSSKQYPAAHSMSSAFSASANPNEDWTKISDLAERRRIQNRIAQRNYRKKLKKRLEDLERRAGSSSASPEAQPAELAQPEPSTREVSTSDDAYSHSSPRQTMLGPQYLLPPEDRMFSQQYTRQISTTPPPFTSASMPVTESFNYTNSYANLTNMGMEQAYGQQYAPQQYTQHMNSLASPPMKQEYYADDDMSPFAISYASISNVDIHTVQGYQGMSPYTPPLLDAFEFSTTGSPPDSLIGPHTPPALAHSPPFYS